MNFLPLFFFIPHLQFSSNCSCSQHQSQCLDRSQFQPQPQNQLTNRYALLSLSLTFPVPSSQQPSTWASVNKKRGKRPISHPNDQKREKHPIWWEHFQEPVFRKSRKRYDGVLHLRWSSSSVLIMVLLSGCFSSLVLGACWLSWIVYFLVLLRRLSSAFYGYCLSYSWPDAD